jgi:hypothetical protein
VTTAPETELTYDRTVAKGLVHVWALSEVFIADSERLSDDEYVCSFQLPRTHCLWGDRRYDYHDPVVTLEIGRQTVFLVLHHYCEVPADWKFVLRRIDFGVVDLEAYADDRTAPPTGVSRVVMSNRVEKHGLLEATFEGDVRIGDAMAMEMSADISVLNPFNYRLLRAQGRGKKPLATAPPPGSPEERIDGEQVGHDDPRNVVLRHQVEEVDGTYRYGLIVDQHHPGFFDHPHDHVTGSLILELYRQAAIATASRAEGIDATRAAVTACSMTFEEFAELDALTECRAEVAGVTPGGGVAVDLALEQCGFTIAEAQLTVSEMPSAAEPAAALAGDSIAGR